MKCFVSALRSARGLSASIPVEPTVRDEASKIPSNDAVPCSSCARVELVHLESGLVLKPQSQCRPMKQREGRRTSFLMYCAISFSTWNLDMASSATSTACRCISSLWEVVSFAADSKERGCNHHIGRFDLGWDDFSRCYTDLAAPDERKGKGRYSQASPSSRLPL